MTIATAPSPVSSPPESPPARHRRPNPIMLLPVIVIGALVTTYFLRWSVPTGPPALTGSGTVEATEVTVASEISGRVRSVLVREGDTVRAGDELVRLDDSTLQLQYRQGSADQQQILGESIAKTILRAPIDGTVIHRMIQPGEVVSAGLALLTVADTERLDLKIYLLQRDIGQVRVGQAVAVTTDSLPGVTFDGVVASIATSAEFTPRNVQTQKDRLGLVFAVTVDVVSDGRLKAGMPVDARVIVP